MAVLRVRKGGVPGTVHAVFSTRQHTVLGREGQVEVPLGDGKASRRHAAISIAHGYWVLQDLKSRNGTLMDGKRIERTILRDGATFQIGGTLLSFHEREMAPPPSLEPRGASLVETIREESGVFTFRARQAALDREIRVDWLHPSRALGNGSKQAIEKAIEDAGRLRGPGFLPVLEASPGGDPEGEGVFVLLKTACASSLEERLPELLSRPLEERLRFFRDLAEILLERATWESFRHPISLAHVLIEENEGLLEPRLPALDLAAFVTAEKGGSSHLRGNADYLPPESQSTPTEEPGEGRTAAPPLSGAMYCLGAIGYHLLAGKKAMGDGDVREVLEAHRSLRPAPASLLEPRIPAAVSALLDRMLEKDPEKRPRGRQEVLAALGPAGPVPAAPVPAAPVPAAPGHGGPRRALPAQAAKPAEKPVSPAARPSPVPAAGARSAPRGPGLSAEASRPASLPRSQAGLLYLPLWLAVWVALFFAARYLTKMVLGGLGA